MRDQGPQPFFPESSLQRLEKERSKDGWALIGKQNLTEVQFQKDARFLPVTVRTVEDIKTETLKKLEQDNPGQEFEVDLILDTDTQQLRDLRKVLNEEEFQLTLEHLADGLKWYNIFARVKPKPQTGTNV